jgi:hypothetical protein
MMDDTLTLNRSEIFTDRKVRTNFNRTNSSRELTKINPVIENLVMEGGENFFNYIDWHGLSNESNMLVLSSRHHYYYEYNDLKGVTTLINLKKLNLIKHLDSFLNSVCNSLSPKTNFIGCFSDRKTKKWKGLISRIYKEFNNFLDSTIDMEINKKDALRLLETHGFKVIDMTEINGLTYFRAQNLRRPVE